MISELLSIANILLGAIAVIAGVRFIRKCRHVSYFVWLRYMNVAICAYWMIIYLYVAIADPSPTMGVWFGQVFIRPALTVTLAVLAANAVSRYRGCG